MVTRATPHRSEHHSRRPVVTHRSDLHNAREDHRHLDGSCLVHCITSGRTGRRDCAVDRAASDFDAVFSPDRSSIASSQVRRRGQCRRRSPEDSHTKSTRRAGRSRRADARKQAVSSIPGHSVARCLGNEGLPNFVSQRRRRGDLCWGLESQNTRSARRAPVPQGRSSPNAPPCLSHSNLR